MSNTNIQKFCELVRIRSEEHRKTIITLVKEIVDGQLISVVSQELDSLIRVIYLLTKESSVRNILIEQTFNHERWKDGKNNITDRAMLDKASYIHGWASMVYDFGCAFIHLSSYHDYFTEDPFSSITEDDLIKIKSYMQQYHSFPIDNDINFNTMKPYLSSIFEKINSNLEYYLCDLEKDPPLKSIY